MGGMAVFTLKVNHPQFRFNALHILTYNTEAAYNRMLLLELYTRMRRKYKKTFLFTNFHIHNMYTCASTIQLFFFVVASLLLPKFEWENIVVASIWHHRLV